MVMRTTAAALAYGLAWAATGAQPAAAKTDRAREAVREAARARNGGDPQRAMRILESALAECGAEKKCQAVLLLGLGLPRLVGLAMAFKLMQSAQALVAPPRLPRVHPAVRAGVRFVVGKQQERKKAPIADTAAGVAGALTYWGAQWSTAGIQGYPAGSVELRISVSCFEV